MIRQTGKGVLLEVRVKPNSKRFALYEKEGRFVLEVTSPPRKGRANLEIVRELKRRFGEEVEIVKGFKKRDKVILIKNLRKEDLEL